MKFVFLVAASLLVGGTLSPAANAATIPVVGGIELDFRTDPWEAGDGFTSISLGGQGDFGTVEVTAFSTASTPKLYHDTPDGFGVRGGENDEIDGVETLTVTFSNLSFVEGIWFTDLFSSENDGPNPPTKPDEHAIVELFAGVTSIAVLDFYGEDLLGGYTDGVKNNGVLYGSLGAFAHQMIDKIVFSSTGLNNDEYSVAGIEGYPIPAPVPAALPLFISGLLGLGIMARRRKHRPAA